MEETRLSSLESGRQFYYLTRMRGCHCGSQSTPKRKSFVPENRNIFLVWQNLHHIPDAVCVLNCFPVTVHAPFSHFQESLPKKTGRRPRIFAAETVKLYKPIDDSAQERTEKSTKKRVASQFHNGSSFFLPNPRFSRPNPSPSPAAAEEEGGRNGRLRAQN